MKEFFGVLHNNVKYYRLFNNLILDLLIWRVEGGGLFLKNEQTRHVRKENVFF